MKQSLLLLAFLLLFQACNNTNAMRDEDGDDISQSESKKVTLTERWVENYSNINGGLITDSTIDNEGNIYTTGGNFSNNIGDLFIVKYDKFGTRLWSKEYDYEQSEEGKAITIDAEGNLYITGEIGDSHQSQTANILLLKVDSQGEELWHQIYGSDSKDEIDDIAIDSQNDIYICGSSKGDLDGNTLVKYTDSFLAKFSTDGEKQWTKSLGQNYSDYAKNLFITHDDNIYIGGSISGVGDTYLAKYTTGGTQKWYKVYHTNNFEYAVNLSLGKDGNFYFSGKVGLRDANKEYIKPNSDEVFARKITKDGKEKYYITFGTSAQNEIAHSIISDKYGNAYLIGTSNGSFTDDSLKDMASPFLTYITPNGTIKSTKEYDGFIFNHAKMHITNDSSLYIVGGGNIYYDGNTPDGNSGFIFKLTLDYQ